jgi:hypothetical protein
MKVMWGGVGGTYVALEKSHRDGTRDAPLEGDLYGNGVPIVVVEVTILKARMGEPSQGRRGTGGQTEAAMLYAKCGNGHASFGEGRMEKGYRTMVPRQSPTQLLISSPQFGL